MSKHVALWIDHKEAHMFAIHPDSTDEATILAPLHNIHHKHPTGRGQVREHPDDAKRFFPRSVVVSRVRRRSLSQVPDPRSSTSCGTS